MCILFKANIEKNREFLYECNIPTNDEQNLVHSFILVVTFNRPSHSKVNFKINKIRLNFVYIFIFLFIFYDVDEFISV